MDSDFIPFIGKLKKLCPQFACAKYKKVSCWLERLAEKYSVEKHKAKRAKKNKHTSKNTIDRDSSPKDLYTMTLELTAQ